MRSLKLAVGVVVGLVGSTAMAGTLVISPTRYGTTYANTAMYGAPTTKTVAHAGQSPAFLVRGASNIHRGYMVFDLSHPDLTGKTIVSVTFGLTRSGSMGPKAEVWGKHASGSDAFVGYSTFNTFAGTVIDPDTSTHRSIITQGTLMGTIGIFANSTVLADTAYFQSKLNSEVLLFSRLAYDLVGDPVPYGPEATSDGGARLTIEYTDAPVIPLPNAGGMALAGLGILSTRRHRRCSPR